MHEYLPLLYVNWPVVKLPSGSASTADHESFTESGANWMDFIAVME
jgi:hypothetical protein